MNLSKSLINASINAKSIDTGIKLQDNILRSEDYFDVEKFSRISMTSTKIEKSINSNEYVGYFSLSIKNFTKNIKIPFIFEQIGKNLSSKVILQLIEQTIKLGIKVF
jgi:polyisoprenoid-binding protein YceI